MSWLSSTLTGSKSFVQSKLLRLKSFFYIHTLSSKITRRTYNFLGRERKTSRMAILDSGPICAVVMCLR